MNKDRIIVFGRGNYFLSKKNSLMEKYEIIGFLDNAVEEKELDEKLNIPIYNPRNVSMLPDCDVFCLSADFISMWKQLKSLEILDERIRFGVELDPLQDGIEKILFDNGESLICRDEKLYYESARDGQRIIDSNDDIKKLARSKLKDNDADIALISELSTKTVSKVFGSERGKAVDREYIEQFLSENSESIKGVVLEVLNNNYTKKLGGNRVSKSVVSHVKGWGKDTVLCNFETGEGVVPNTYDCIICTQTLQYIFDVKSAMMNIYNMLKPGGCALITVPGIKPLCEYDDSHWGEYWSFTSKSIKRIIEEVCGVGDACIKTYGNVKTATAYLYGICVEELSSADFIDNDERFPFIIGARINKPV